ncbi:MAG: carbohydrate porin [Burkholderiaceae bacterium]|nr:carbohydrate porin [Burkholderiaceae bacterium]
MRCPLPLKTLVVATALGLGAAGGASAATNTQLAELLEKLNQRVQKLEQANADLQRELAASRAVAVTAPAPATPAMEKRLQALEQQQTVLAESLDKDTISEKEPDISARLKAVETRAQELAGPVGKLKALDGIKGGMALSMVAQKSLATSADDGQLGYRTDAFVSLPLDSIGDMEQTVFAQLRLGQGTGLTGLPSSYASPLATAFQLGGLGADASVVLLAQAWYQATIPLPLGGFKPASKQKLEITVGKMDPFVLFDQNAVAGDETRQFLNSVFVHNPLLDAGGDIGVDGNGFTPGLRVSLLDSSDKLESWRVSLGLFGAGNKGSNYQGSLGAPLVMLQAETQQRFFGGLLGNYRAYAWSNPQSTPFAFDLPLADTALSAPERHNGWGLSMDQRVGDGMTLFARYGQQSQGQVKFDRALTLGFEANGSYWSRGGDSLGLALGWLRTSDAYRDYKLTDPNDPRAISEPERVAELYYRWRVAKQFELTPSLQFIASPAGDSSAPDVRIVGLRSQFSF